MEQDVTRKIRYLFQRMELDPEYAEMLLSYRELEKKLGNLTRDMSEADQDIIWGFISLSDSMNWRMLEVPCEEYLHA